MLTPERKTRWATIGSALVLIGLPLLAAAEPKLHDHGSVSYISGGVGTDERREIESMGSRFNLKLTMAMNDGHFVGDPQVRIQDSKGETLVDATADGPLFYANLPSGSYSVSCILEGKEKKQNVTVGDKQQQVTCTW